MRDSVRQNETRSFELTNELQDRSLSVPVRQSANSSAHREESGLDPKILISAFRRRWILATSLGLVCGLAAALPIYKMTPTPYTAFSEIRIRSVDPRFFFAVDDGEAQFPTYKQSQIKLFTSPFVIMAALRKPEVAKTNLVRENKDALAWLEENLQISSPATEFLRASLSGDDPVELATIVNAVTDSYLKEVVGADEARHRSRLSQLQQVLTKAEERLATKRRQLQDLSGSISAANAQQRDQKHQHILDMHIELRRELAGVSLELLKSEIELGVRKQAAEENDETEMELPDEVIDAQLAKTPEFHQAEQRLAILQRTLANTEQGLSAQHPRVVQAREDVAAAIKARDELKTSLRPQVISDIRNFISSQGGSSTTELQANVQRLSRLKSELLSQLESMKIEEEKTGIRSIELGMLEKDIADGERVAKQFSEEIERIKVEFNAEPRIESFRKASVPTVASPKKRFMYTSAGGFGLFGLVVGSIVLLEYRSTRIGSHDEVSKCLNARVVGNVPNMPRFSTNARSRRQRIKAAFWQSVLMESVDSLRTMLLRSAGRSSLKTVMITSAMGGEGKSTLSCHLATSMARAGRKVLLIDGDIRRPSINRVFDLPMAPGLCEILRGEAQVEECLQRVEPTGLTVLPAGTIDKQVLRLLAEDRFGDVLESIKPDFDFILVDSSPIVPITDTLLLVQHVDSVLFTVRRDVSRASKVSIAQQRLSMLGIENLSAVLVGFDTQRGDKSYAYYQPIRTNSNTPPSIQNRTQSQA